VDLVLTNNLGIRRMARTAQGFIRNFRSQSRRFGVAPRSFCYRNLSHLCDDHDSRRLQARVRNTTDVNIGFIHTSAQSSLFLACGVLKPRNLQVYNARVSGRRIAGAIRDLGLRPNKTRLYLLGTCSLVHAESSRSLSRRITNPVRETNALLSGAIDETALNGRTISLAGDLLPVTPVPSFRIA
jgi:hypothetical protein